MLESVAQNFGDDSSMGFDKPVRPSFKKHALMPVRFTDNKQGMIESFSYLF